MKLYSFLYEKGSYQKIYQSFNRKNIEFTRNKLMNDINEGHSLIGKIYTVEVDIENDVWTA